MSPVTKWKNDREIPISAKIELKFLFIYLDIESLTI